MMNKNLIIEKYLRMLALQIKGSVSTDDHIYFSCPLCGDSKNSSVKRGHLKLNKKCNDQFWYYKCFNGGCIANETMSAEKFLKIQFPSLYSQYIQDFLSNKTSIDDIIELNRKIEKQKQENKKVINNEVIDKEELENIKHFISINKKHSLCIKAIDDCKKRLIPKEIYKNFFIATDGIYKNRMIIPFYDNKNKIYYYQARTLNDSKVKYLNRKFNKENAIYNIYNVDKTKPICVLEGPIDSMFIENSIAILGVNIQDSIKEKLEELDCYYLFDNDIAGKKISLSYLKENKFVFNWFDFLKDNNLGNAKDINDVYKLMNRKNKFTFDELRKYFTNNFFDSIKFR